MTMMVKCKDCHFEHPSAFQMEKATFETASLSNNSEQCPQCGTKSSYNKEEYFFK